MVPSYYLGALKNCLKSYGLRRKRLETLQLQINKMEGVSVRQGFAFKVHARITSRIEKYLIRALEMHLGASNLNFALFSKHTRQFHEPTFTSLLLIAERASNSANH